MSIILNNLFLYLINVTKPAVSYGLTLVFFMYILAFFTGVFLFSLLKNKLIT